MKNARRILKTLRTRTSSNIKALMVFGLGSALFGPAHGAPMIDPTLEPLMNGAGGSEMVTVIATFEDQSRIPYLENSRRTYRDMRVGLTENARASQTRVYQALRNGAESSGIPMNLSPLWLTNTMIIEIPAHSVKYLQNFSEIKALIADHPIQIYQPLSRSTVSMAVQTETDYTYGLKKLQVPELRRRHPGITGRGINVGVLDTGIDPQHPDLVGRTVAFQDFVGRGQAPYDDHGHGTHVAGTIGGTGTSGVDIGVAPEVVFTVGKVFTRTGGGSLAAILRSMDWIADPDGNPDTNDAPLLVNNSWGGGATNGRNDPVRDVYCKAVDNWVRLGIFPVFAAGNSGSGSSSVGLPAACPSAFAVGATDENDAVASFSSRGPARWSTGNIVKPEVSAPGVDIRSAFPGGGYRVWSGTSMATPHVAGLAALIFQASPGLAAQNVAQILIEGAEHLGAPGQNNDYGFGRINALRSFGER